MAKNILICDDAAFMRMMIKDILTKNGYNVVGEAENGAKAVEKYQELKPDLVLMDITMPEMDGIQALKAIKAADPSATVIMCSAMGQQAMVIESIQSGAKDFIVKPFQQDRVLEAVRKRSGFLIRNLFGIIYMMSATGTAGSFGLFLGFFKPVLGLFNGCCAFRLWFCSMSSYNYNNH